MRLSPLGAGTAAALVLALGACGSPSSGGAGASASASPSTSASASPSAAPSDPAEPTASALSFDLPTDPEYRPDGTRVGDDGQIVRAWRAKIGSGSPYCTVVAGEQPRFSGAFPEATIAAFRLGHEDGTDLKYNEKVPPIAGTVAGVRQSRTYVFSLGVRGTASGVLMVRQYLTADHTLISLNVAGPADSAQVCGLQAIVDSLRVSSAGDEEPPLVLPTPSAPATPTTAATVRATTGSQGVATSASGAESTP